MEAEKIKKALEHCSAHKECGTECPYFKRLYCVDMAMQDALALITEQEEKIKKLTEENERLSKEVADLQDELKCEKDTNEHLCGEYMSAKADTVREMQELIKERCIKYGIYPAFVASVIDQTAKELLEAKND